MHPWEDEDNAAKGPEITTWIMKHLFSDPPNAPTPRMGQMVQLHRAQSILTVGLTREADPRDYSMLRNDMPHREHVDAPEKQPRLTWSVAGWMAPQYFACHRINLALQYLAWQDQSA